MKKSLQKLLFTFILVCTLFVGTVNAAPNSITVGKGEYLTNIISNRKFHALVASDGSIVYCLDFHKDTPNGSVYNLAGEADAGLAYILQNGYPHKRYTNNVSHDKFLTAIAVWWYLDDTTGSSNITNDIKTGSDPHNLRPTIKALVAAAKAYKRPTFSLSASVANKKMVVTTDGKHYQSDLITVASSGISTYSVALTDAPSGTTIVAENGAVKTTFNAGEKFRVKTPIANIKENKLTLKLTISSSGTYYKAFKYNPADSSKQRVTLSILEPFTTNLSAKVDLDLSRSVMKISKKDITNKKELPGATLVIKDANGKIVDQWVSSDKEHFIYDLPAGKYTLTETIAPNGYILSTEKISFTVKADGTVQTVTMYNSKKPVPTPTPTPTPTPDEPGIEIEVPKTASSISILIYTIGLLTIAGGAGLVYHNGKVKK